MAEPENPKSPHVKTVAAAQAPDVNPQAPSSFTTPQDQLIETAENYRRSIAALEAATARDGVDRSATIATEKNNLQKVLAQIKP